MFGPNATYELGRVWSWQKSVAPDKNARDKGWLLYIFLCKNWIRCHFLIKVFFWWGNGGMVRCNWTIYCFCTVNLTSEVIFFLNETVMAASSSSSFKSVRSSPFMRPFWSCLESRAKFLKVQSALPRFGSVLWLVYIPPPPPHFSGRSLGRTAWRIKRMTSAGEAIPLVARRATRNICVIRLRAKTELPSRVTTRINQTAVAKNHSNFKVLNTVLAVSEYMSSAKSWQEKGCS